MTDETNPDFMLDPKNIELLEQSIKDVSSALIVLGTSVAGVVCKGLQHLLGASANVISLLSARGDAFSVMIQHENKMLKAYVVLDVVEFLSRVKDIIKPLVANNLGYKDPQYLFGVAVETVLEKHYRLQEENITEVELKEKLTPEGTILQ